MTNTSENITSAAAAATAIAATVDRYIAIWSIADPSDRTKAVAELWTDNAIEYIEGQQYIGRTALVERVAEAYEAFVATNTYTAAGGDDATVHGDMVTFTIRLDQAQGPDAGETAWSARVFLLLDENGKVREDYQLTVKPLAA